MFARIFYMLSLKEKTVSALLNKPINSNVDGKKSPTKDLNSFTNIFDN